jgi:hypothetical protein
MANLDQNSIDRVWHIIERVAICMMTTRFEGGLRARPLEARPDRDGNVIWFLTDRRGLGGFPPHYEGLGIIFAASLRL